MTKLLYTTILIFGYTCLFAQMPQPQKLLPVLAPSSPEAAAFNRYGNYQVNLFTGIPEISIPLYEIKVGELTVPISLNYHSSGIKVSDIPSRAGLGWDLQAGGSITRKIMGKPDELNGNYLSASPTSMQRVRTTQEINPLIQDGIDYLYNVDRGLYDVEPDIFSYSFPGHGGKFLFNQKDNYKPILIPYAPISVEMTPLLNNLSLGITDENGNGYKFNNNEWTTTGGGITTSCNSAWLLSDMISVNKQDTIHFSYISGSGNIDSYISNYMTLDDNATGAYGGANTTGAYFTDNGTVYTTWQQMTQIDFKNGRVVFEAAPDVRSDFGGVNIRLQNRINSIKIYSQNSLDKSYTLIKSIQFFQSYFINGADNNTKRLRLDSIQILMTNGSAVQTYKFNYNTNISLPINTSHMKDYWGYFNNINNLDPFGNPTLIPRTQVLYTTPTNGSSLIWIGGDHINARDPDPNYMQANILQKITFPTGGFTQFEYETNQYLDDIGNAKYAGGLRIKKIKSYADISASPVVKTYKYGQNESGFGRRNFAIEDHLFLTSQNVRRLSSLQSNGFCGGDGRKTTRTYFSNPTYDLEPYDGASVEYTYVTEYTGDTINNIGKTVYQFNNKDDIKQNIIGYNKPIFWSYHFIRGLVTNKAEYKRNLDNSFSLVSEDRKKYQFFPFKNTTSGLGLVVLKTDIVEGYAGLSFGTLCGDPNLSMGTDSYAYKYNNYEIVTGDNKLIADTSISYDQNDPSKFISSISNYNYDDTAHLQIVQTQSFNSKGQILNTNYTYPYNYLTAPYTNMTSNHMFNKVVTESKTKNNNPISLQTNNYATFPGNNYLVSNIQLKIGTNAPEIRAYFNQYDVRGNIIEQQKANDVRENYIWSYNKMYPVAKIIGSNSTAVNAVATATQSQIDAAVSNDATMRSVLNNLRTSLPNAFVTTYTYAPLVGITSQTDPNGHTTYYEYDGFNRLKLIRDQDNNIIKTFNYNYKH